MPSFDRLLVLAVLALSVSVQSAPVGPDSSYGLAPIEGGLVPAPGVDHGGVVSAASANEFDDEEESLDTRDFDEEQDLDLDEDYADPSTFERRASKKTKAAPKPKPTRAPKLVSTKAAAPKLKTIKANTTLKPATTTKATTTSKVAKTAKITKTSKPSITATATGAASPSACPIKKPATKPRSFASRAYDYVAHLFERDNEEFIGWHGTNSNTAALWAAKGYIQKPVEADGFRDYIGIGSGKKAVVRTSGANSEIGFGLYVSDIIDTSLGFANFNPQNNLGTTGALCAIFAKSSGNWRNVIRKAFIPDDPKMIGQDLKKEAARVAYIKKVVPGVSPDGVVRFAVLDPRGSKTSQLVIPESIATQFSAKCFKVDGLSVAESDLEASKVGTVEFLDYKGNKIRDNWKIVPENGGAAGTPGCS